MSYEREYAYAGQIKEKIRFDTYEELENYFERNFDIFKKDKTKTKVIGKVIYIF
jgi:hypothetical protein